MTNTNNIKNKLNEAIESGNTELIREMLKSYPVDGPELSADKFARRIIKLSKEENKMKMNIKKIIIIAAAAATVCCVSAGAAVCIKSFGFGEDGKFVRINTNADMSEDEARQIAQASAEDYGTEHDESAVFDDYDSFATVEEAEQAYNMKVVLPERMPDLPLTDITGEEFYLDKDSAEHTLWIDYGDPESKAFSLVIEKRDYNDSDISSTLVTDSELKDTYVSAKGCKFYVLEDKGDGKTATMMSTDIGSYSCTMGYIGFDDEEIKQITDSFDPEAYKG